MLFSVPSISFPLLQITCFCLKTNPDPSALYLGWVDLTEQQKRSLGNEKQTMLDNRLGDLFIECPLDEDHGEKYKKERTHRRSPPSKTSVVQLRGI